MMSAVVDGGKQLEATIKSPLTNTHTPDNDSDDQVFVYPGANDDHDNVDKVEEEAEEEEEFVYPGAHVEISAEHVASPPIIHPSPAQLESLYAAASSGDLGQLKRLFRNALEASNVEPFSLANDASSRTGFTALHAAASRGYLDIVTWLVQECGAMPDLEDKEGETALHKAALNGHLAIVKYLLPERADVHARDADGWMALHNACAKGYLDIVRWLCEYGRAASEVDGVRGIDARSKGGWTPLMNAASKGHLPVVLYLLTKQSADPLVRNNWGETAFDAAAAVFEVWICQVLQKSETEQWRESPVSYDPLMVHTTVPLIIHEHQRLDTRLKTLAVNGGRPKFSASGLGKQGRRAPFELKLLRPDEDTGAQEVGTWRSDVQLPYRDNPWKLPKPGPNDRPGMEGAERSHFWLSDWTLDVTHPAVDAEDGWQYARRFSDSDDQWTAEMPPQLERMLNGGIVSNNVASSSRSSSVSSRSGHTWVRRRRWVRVMRRRLDIPPLPFLQPDGLMYLLTEDGHFVPFIEENRSDFGGEEGQELSSMPISSGGLSSHNDYVSRARYLVGSHPSNWDNNNATLSAVDMRRDIAKLERATTELRQGILTETESERKTQAEVLLNAYSRDLERRRLAAGAQGLLIIDTHDTHEDYDDDDDDEFHYPGASRPESPNSTATDYFNNRPSLSRTVTDLTPQLSQAPDFRVPTHEAPQKIFSTRMTPTPHQMHAQWERDEVVQQCRDCQRRFNFLLRRHCRRCGRIFCDRCSSFRALLDPAEIVQDPTFAENAGSSSTQRVCQNCFDEATANVPSGLRGMGATSMERVVIDQDRLIIPGQDMYRETSSQLSDLAECPVCNKNLDKVGNAAQQEAHVRTCLEGGSGAIPQAAKYLVYKLPAESTLIGVECVICLEEFVEGSTVARLSCFCSFHNHCLSSWLQRGKSCPVHAR